MAKKGKTAKKADEPKDKNDVGKLMDAISTEKTVIKADMLNEDKFERSKRIGWLNMDNILKSKVLVVGVGALGNEVCKNLVLTGYKNIDIVDMDYIVKSNLNRCVFFSELDAKEKKLKAEVVADRMKKMEPDINVKYYTDKIENLPEDFIPSHEVVFGCLDNIAARLHVNAHCYYHGIPYIDGGTLGMLGKVQVIYPPKSSCLECGMNKTHMKILEKRFSCTGANITYYEAKLAAEITTTSVVAAVQVREALKITCKKEDMLITNMFYYDANRNFCDVFEIPISPDCPHHKKA